MEIYAALDCGVKQNAAFKFKLTLESFLQVLNLSKKQKRKFQFFLQRLKALKAKNSSF